MKEKIKYAARAVSLAALTFPAIAAAQFSTPTSATGLSGDNALVTLARVLNWLLAAVGVLGVIAFVIAGIMYLTAAGDEDRIKQAKGAMTYAVVGIVVALIGLIIVTTAGSIFGSGATNPTQ